MAGEEADLVAKKLSVAVPEPVGVDTIEAAPVKALKIQANKTAGRELDSVTHMGTWSPKRI